MTGRDEHFFGLYRSSELSQFGGADLKRKNFRKERLERKMSAFGERKGDPVASDQGGRIMQFDPAGSTEENVRRRAYELYEQRGAAHGLADSDWLAAEAQVLGIRRTW